MKHFRLLFSLILLLLCFPALVYALSVNLAWDYTQGSTAATNFVMERCVGSGCTGYSTLSTTIPVATLAYSDTAVTYNTWYSYRVRAKDAQGGLSAPSNVVSFQTPAATVDAPVNLRGTVTP